MAWSSANQFISQTLGHSYDMDGYPSGQRFQCWDYADYFWVNQVGRMFITKPGGKGCILDCWNISRSVNAGKEFDIIRNFNELRTGDWAAFGGSKTGHIGIVVSRSGNTVVLQGQNQGSIRAKVTRITMASTFFLGAWRLKAWNAGGSTTGFLPPKGYWTFGDCDARIGQMASFMRATFPAYTSALALGNYFGTNLTKSIKEFQRRVGIVADGSVGRITYGKLREYGFKG